MKYINKYNNFNPINESIDNKSVVDDIIDISSIQHQESHVFFPV